MKKTLIAVIAVIVLVHIVLFVPRAVRGKGLIDESVQREGAEAAPADSLRADTRAALPPPENVRELLKRYAATLDRLSSFIIKSETTKDTDGSYSGEYEFFPASLSGRWTSQWSTDLRYDGRRYSKREYGQGDIRGPHTTLPRGKKSYRSWFWDGTRFGNYIRGWEPSHRDRMCISPAYVDPSRGGTVAEPVAGGPLIGYLPRIFNVRVDELLSRSGNASMQAESDGATGAALYRVDADTKFGGYTIWLDPAHDYHMVKARVVRAEGDIWISPDSRVEAGRVQTVMFSVGRFEEVDGLWAPMEADIEIRNDFANGDCGVRKFHHVRTSVVLDPDHDALGSFLLDDIRNGTRVLDENGQVSLWQDGKLVPEKD